MKCIEYLHDKLYQKEPIPFVDFMQDALYAPNIGYYTGGLPIFGQAGDFVTAPELTPLFGQTLANQCEQILSELDHPILFEFGAGSGKLCVSLLKQLQILNCLPDEYHILELSGHLQARQQAYILQEIPELSHRIKWLSSWPKTPFNGVILANEVLDAMPIHRFLQTSQGLLESYIGLNAQSELVELFKPCVNQPLTDHVHMVLPPDAIPYLSEANLLLDPWLQHCFDMLGSGVLLIIDYGFPRHEYYHPDRNQGTLMCHYHHQAHTNPLIHPGEQDITAHVDFTHVAIGADNAGFHVAGYTNQASFLLNNGVLNLSQSEQNTPTQSINNQVALKQLLQPTEMGELFKVIALTKQYETPLRGFQLHDKRASL